MYNPFDIFTKILISMALWGLIIYFTHLTINKPIDESINDITGIMSIILQYMYFILLCIIFSIEPYTNITGCAIYH